MVRMELWHNPGCSKSCAAKRLLDERGVAYQERRYLEDAPSTERLDEVLTALGLQPWDVARLHETVAGKLGLQDWPHDRQRWITAMVAHPELIERPIVVADDGRAAIGRPVEAISDLLDGP